MEIKALHSMDEMPPAVELQKIYWGNDIESVVPSHMLYTIATTGGHVLVVLDDGKMIGVLIGLIAIDKSKQVYIASKRMVVLPEYRSQGIGYQLKMSQREVAIQQGIELVTWTFDPLLAKNAYLNLHKLGCISPKYLENYYGTDDSKGLSTLGSSDRLHVEWWVQSDHVTSVAEGQRATLDTYFEQGAVVVNSVRYTEGIPQPIDSFTEPNDSMALLEVPFDYPSLVQNDKPLAITWREHTRSTFQNLMSQGYIVTDFVRDQYEGRDSVFYVMSME